jgi:hypothetical protein
VRAVLPAPPGTTLLALANSSPDLLVRSPYRWSKLT